MIENMRRCEQCTALRPESKLSRQDTTWHCRDVTLCEQAATRLAQTLAADRQYDYYRDHWFDTDRSDRLHSQTVPPWGTHSGLVGTENHAAPPRVHRGVPGGHPK